MNAQPALPESNAPRRLDNSLKTVSQGPIQLVRRVAASRVLRISDARVSRLSTVKLQSTQMWVTPTATPVRADLVVTLVRRRRHNASAVTTRSPDRLTAQNAQLVACARQSTQILFCARPASSRSQQAKLSASPVPKVSTQTMEPIPVHSAQPAHSAHSLTPRRTSVLLGPILSQAVASV